MRSFGCESLGDVPRPGGFQLRRIFDVGNFFSVFLMTHLMERTKTFLWIVVLVRIMEFNPQTNSVKFQAEVGCIPKWKNLWRCMGALWRKESFPLHWIRGGFCDIWPRHDVQPLNKVVVVSSGYYLWVNGGFEKRRAVSDLWRLWGITL